MQTTVQNAITFSGVGLHSGAPVTMVIRPATSGFGIQFSRVDLHPTDARVLAIWNAVNQWPLCTRIENANGVSVSTIEHVMAALVGCGVHNALIELDGPEAPILDGSSIEYVRALLAAGLRSLDAPVVAIEVLKPVEARRGEAFARLVPGEGLQIDFRIDFEDKAIGTQFKRMNMSNGSFVRELSDSRTFCRKSDVEAMRAQGLALGGTMENAVVVDGDAVLSPGGLRHSDEAVRHKMLDALGDLALAGAPIIGHYVGHRAGHALTNDLLRALFADPTIYRLIECTEAQAALLPGAGVHAGELPRVA